MVWDQDWSSDGHDLESPAWQRNWYGRSKVDTEHLVNAAAAASDGRWDAITMSTRLNRTTGTVPPTSCLNLTICRLLCVPACLPQTQR
jgi:hypothetical protein